MTLYHGSNVEVAEPRILASSHSLDFGPGFYTTLFRGQAEDFARKVVLRKGAGRPTVNIYEIDEKVAFPLCDVLTFDRPNDVWLDFVCSNRDGVNVAKGRDMVLGPVANDDVYHTFALYRNGDLTREETLTRLKVKKLYNQLVFATEKALQFIRFKGSESVHV